MKRPKSNIEKSRRRPKARAIPVTLRLSAEQASQLDRWRKTQSGRPGRPEAIRRLVERGLVSSAARRPRRKGAARKAAELAAEAIDKLVPETYAPEEKQRAKRRLIQGPKDFREIRSDQSKRK